MFSLAGAGTNGWVNIRDASDFRRHRAHYDVAVMTEIEFFWGFLTLNDLQVQNIVDSMDIPTVKKHKNN